MGISRIDNILMVLGISLEMNEAERHVVTKEMIRGFNDCATEAGTSITGGQSIMNPWPIIGGVANVVCHEDEYTKVNQAQPGDALVLTKPLGTQVAVNLKDWLVKGDTRAVDFITDDDAVEAYHKSIESMSLLNLNAARLMRKYSCHGATDITGFGIKGHAQNLVAVQEQPVNFHIESLPILANMAKINSSVLDFKLTAGYSAETSGGLFIAVPEKSVKSFMAELKGEYGQDSWVVGHVTKGERVVELREDADIVEV
jgi:selenide,water dikinase